MRISLHPFTIALTTSALVALAACSDGTINPVEPGILAAKNVTPPAAGGVYTMTNGASANSVLAFQRAADGSLTSLGGVPTGGAAP